MISPARIAALARKEVRHILRDTTLQERRGVRRLGSRIAARFEHAGLSADLLASYLTINRELRKRNNETIASLAKVGPMEPNYVASLYEICQLRYQLWSRAKADASKSAPLAADQQRRVFSVHEAFAHLALRSCHLAQHRRQSLDLGNVHVAVLSVDF